MYYSKAQSDLSPEYDDCPGVCGEGGKPNCSECPVKTAREDFEQSLKETLTDRLKDKWQKYGFNKLLETVADVSQIEDLDRSRQTITTARLISILTSERRRIERIDEWNRKQSASK